MRMLVAAWLWLAAARVYAIALDDEEHFQVKNTWSATALGVPTPLGGLVFSPDGATLYVVGGADKSTSVLYALPVTRDAADRVTGFGAAAPVFMGSGGLDAGLEHGPAGTLFYSCFATNQLGERPGGVGSSETRLDLGPHGVPSAIAGLTFSPFRIDPATGFGRLQISTSFGNVLYELPLAPTGGGLFTPGDATPFVALPLASISGLHYIPAGTLAGQLLYANFDEGQLRLLRIDAGTGLPIDAQTGEPTLATASPLESPFASEFGVGPLGLEFDARTNDDLFVTTFGGVPTDSLIQIVGFSGTFVTTTTTTTSSAPPTTEPVSTTTAPTTVSTVTSTSATSTVPSTAPITTTIAVSTTTTSVPPTTLPPTSSTTTTTPVSTTSTATSVPATTTSSSAPATSTSSTLPTTSTVTSSTDTTSSSSTTSSTSTTAPETSSTTVSSTTSSSLAPSTTITPTTSSLPPPTTTSTERPVITPTTTVPGECERVPTFPSVRCRLALLRRKIDDARDSTGRLAGPLLRHARRAERCGETAEERASAGRIGRARRLVRRVLVELRAVENALGARHARAVPESIRAALLEVTSTTRADARTLRASLAAD